MIQHMAKALTSRHTQTIIQLDLAIPINVDTIKIVVILLNFFNIEKVMFI